jgi:hypothetical protein
VREGTAAASKESKSETVRSETSSGFKNAATTAVSGNGFYLRGYPIEAGRGLT